MTKVGYAALFGPANAGKSTLLNRILGEKVSIVSSKPQTTRQQVLGVYNTPRSQLIFLDTPGFVAGKHRDKLSRFLDQARDEALKEVDVPLLVLDARNPVITAKGKLPSELIILNKIDLLKKGQVFSTLKRVSEQCASLSEKPVEIFPVSAKTGEGIDELLRSVEKLLPEGPRYYPEDVRSDSDPQWFVAEIIREKLYRQLNQELPYSVAVKIEQWTEEDNLIKLRGVVQVERNSQKGMVIGKSGSKLKSIATAARLELEQYFGCKVFLELLVRVEPNWTKSDKNLRAAGYGL